MQKKNRVGKKCVGVTPPPLLSAFFKAGAVLSEAFCPPPPLSKYPGAAPAYKYWEP